MNFLFYYVLRKFFVKLRFSDKEISLEKGLLLKRLSVMPMNSVVRITSRRTLFLRLFRAKEIEVFTLGGKMRFFLSRNERLPFLPEKRRVIAKPRFREIMLGAFIDTRALGGIFVFAAVLRRISAIFGGEYLNYIISALSQTAGELEKALGFFRVTVPRIAITLAAFALGAWIFAYLRKLARLARFRVSVSGGVLFAESGVVTLYEHALVSNSAASSECAVIRCDTLTTVLARRAPLYFRGVMVCPCSKRIELPAKRLSSPKRAFFGHIAGPLASLGNAAENRSVQRYYRKSLYRRFISAVYAPLGSGFRRKAPLCFRETRTSALHRCFPAQRAHRDERFTKRFSTVVGIVQLQNLAYGTQKIHRSAAP